ncbi:MAG: FAD-dependent oxidoreductase [Candidatus Brocadiia bacterium]
MVDRETLTADFCVIGGGMAGLCAALAAARCGADTVLVHERPVLGGNASSECRVHVTGAGHAGDRPNARETGILEELQLRNLAVNPHRNYSIWDTVLHEATIQQPNLRTVLNCSVHSARMDGPRIASVTGWQMTSQKQMTVEAQFFADCTGDGITAAIAGAEARRGREARDEFGESLAPEQADDRTMGMSCLFCAVPTDQPQPFTPPDWAYTFESEEDLPHRRPGRLRCGYWWIELGGDGDSIADTEEVRDELLKIVYGIWDHVKNHGDYGADNWRLDWVQFLPAKRESRRLVGDHLLCQGDIESGGRFEDTVAYGGWPMDRHPPKGFWHTGPPALFGKVPEVYGIPLRSLYSANVPNLWMAGRDASCTHIGMSSTRVMGTGSVMGQAVGTAVAYALRRGVSPAECAAGGAIDAIQQKLLSQDCYLPRFKRRFSEATQSAGLTAELGDPEPLRDGVNRPVGEEEHAWTGDPGQTVEYRWSDPRPITSVSIAFDSNLSEPIALSLHHDRSRTQPPPELVKSFRIEAEVDGAWRTVHAEDDNCQRSRRIAFDGLAATAVRLVPQETRGAERVRMFTFALNEPAPDEFS